MMKNNPNHWLELLFKLKSWKDGMALTEQALNEHEAQQVILARRCRSVGNRLFWAAPRR
jgi:hypothetical protein